MANLIINISTIFHYLMSIQGRPKKTKPPKEGAIIFLNLVNKSEKSRFKLTS